MSVNMDPNKKNDFDIDASQTVREENTTVEDVARSIGYIVGAPIVCATSIVGAGLFFFFGDVTCHGCWDGCGVEIFPEDSWGNASPLRKSSERFLGKYATRCLVVFNQGFYDLAQPFQKRARVICPSWQHSHNN